MCISLRPSHSPLHWRQTCPVYWRHGAVSSPAVKLLTPPGKRCFDQHTAHILPIILSLPSPVFIIGCSWNTSSRSDLTPPRLCWLNHTTQSTNSAHLFDFNSRKHCSSKKKCVCTGSDQVCLTSLSWCSLSIWLNNNGQYIACNGRWFILLSCLLNNMLSSCSNSFSFLWPLTPLYLKDDSDKQMWGRDFELKSHKVPSPKLCIPSPKQVIMFPSPNKMQFSSQMLKFQVCHRLLTQVESSRVWQEPFSVQYIHSVYKRAHNDCLHLSQGCFFIVQKKKRERTL